MENIHQKYPDLFSPSLKVRYEATRAFEQRGLKHEPETWEACWGSANGWTMLVGPSPGSRKDGTPDPIDHLAPRRKLTKQTFIRTKACEIQFQDEWIGGKKPEKQTRREWHWTRFMTAATSGGRDMAEALTTVANLDFLNCALENKIRKQRLKDGCTTVFEVMKATRPRLVIPLTDLVYRLLVENLGKFKARRDINHSYPDVRYSLVWFTIPGCDFESVVIKAPKHPSRIPSNHSLQRMSELIQVVLPD